jgi:hypothetical protein
MPDGNFHPAGDRSLLWVALGRQRVGKTALFNTTIQYFRALGSHIEIWNADQQNRTHSLSTFFPDALVPPHGGLADATGWIEWQLKDQVKRRYHAVLDAGGGWTGFSSLVEDVPVIDALAQQGTDVIGLFCVGCEQADLDYLNHFAEGELFVPARTVIVLNAGLILSGRSAGGAFTAIRENPAFKAAVNRGAKVVMMPALACMSEVTDRGISFAEAAEGKVRPGQEPLSLFDPARVREWWTKKVPDFFGQLPPEWLPMARQPAPPVSKGGSK